MAPAGFGEWHEKIVIGPGLGAGGGLAPAGLGRPAGGHYPGQFPAAADRHSRFCHRRLRPAPAAPISPAWCGPTWNAPAFSARSTPRPLSIASATSTRVPNFANWRTINAQGLVVGRGDHAARRPAAASISACGTSSPAQPDAGARNSPPSRQNWRRIAHLISDAIYERITGEKGYFDTRIVFISETGPAHEAASSGWRSWIRTAPIRSSSPMASYMVLTPRFNPTAQMIAYMSYIGGKPRVYLFDIETGQQEVLGNFPNMTFSPRFSPDGNRVVADAGDRRQFRHLHHGFAQPRDCAPDHRSGDRHRALLFAGRTADRVRIRPRRQPADLCDECRRLGSSAASVSAQGATARRSGRPRGDLIAFTKRVGSFSTSA